RVKRTTLERKNAHHRIMYETIAGHDRRRVDARCCAVVARDAPARLFDDDDGCGHIPRLQALFVKALKATTGDVSHIERRRAVAADALRGHDEVDEVAREIVALAHVIWKAGADERAVQVFDFGD